VGLGGIITIDLITFGIAMLTLLPFRLPVPMGGEGDASFGARMRIAWRFIFGRRGLVGLMIIFMGIEFLAALTYFSILPALILSRSGGSESAFGLVQAMLGVGGVVGGIIVSIWGLPRRRIHAVLGLCGLSFLLGDMVFALGHSLPVWMAAGFMAAVFIPAIGGGYRTIWQSKTPPHMQGRVFALMGMFQNSVKPVGYLVAGPLADRLLEPAMQPGGALAPLLGGIFGTGSGAGIALMFALTGILGTAVSFGGYLYGPARRVEQELPDYDTPPIGTVQTDEELQELVQDDVPPAPVAVEGKS
jgi:MFS transporter, DHA3 family, macrolide efflux protein